MTRRPSLPAGPARLLPLLLLVALLPACGDSEPGPPPPVPDALPGTPPEVEAALLTADDLGEGWVDQGATPFEERGLDACPATDVLTAAPDQRREGEAQSYYVEGEAGSPAFFVSVSLWDSVAVAQQRLRTFAGAQQCPPGSTRMPDGRQARVTVEGRPAPDLGDEAVGLVVRFGPERGPGGSLDSVAVRVGRAVVFTYGERYDDGRGGLDPARLESLTAQAVGKAERTLAPVQRAGT